jgi:hypothetical protein
VCKCLRLQRDCILLRTIDLSVGHGRWFTKFDPLSAVRLIRVTLPWNAKLLRKTNLSQSNGLSLTDEGVDFKLPVTADVPSRLQVFPVISGSVEG